MSEAAFEPVVDDPSLPRVLLIGDSISIGYTPGVRRLLAGKANVHRPGENCEHTWHGLKRLDAWLGDGPWGVIHFNFGLHDLKFAGSDGQNTSPELGRQVSTLEQYQANLERIVERLERTGARLTWCNTTPVPGGSQWRIEGTQRAYNEAAGRVMRAHRIAIDDLCAFASARLASIQRPNNVHFTDEGYNELARTVAACIEQTLIDARAG